ncbi:MAG: hypothetical protein J5634_01810 [Bacilli bacterium]|nr:hypothetical protein [Bacilli bacterium]
MEHLVRSHDGCGHYISNNDSEIITAWCEICGDRDDILLSYDETNIKEPFRSLFRYFIRNLIFSRKKLNEQLDLFDVDIIGNDKAIDEILYIANCEIEDSKYILKELYEEKYIDEELYNKLIRYLDLMLFREFKYFDKLGFNLDNNITERVRKENKLL